MGDAVFSSFSVTSCNFCFINVMKLVIGRQFIVEKLQSFANVPHDQNEVKKTNKKCLLNKISYRTNLSHWKIAVVKER